MSKKKTQLKAISKKKANMFAYERFILINDEIERMHRCIVLLREKTILSPEETDNQWELLHQMFTFTRNGKIIWDDINKKRLVDKSGEDIVDTLHSLLQKPLDKDVYIQWSTVNLPIIKTNLDAALAILEDVRKVFPEIFLFNPQQGYVIEILRRYPNKVQIIVGLSNQKMVG